MFKSPIILCSSLCKHSLEFVKKMKDNSEKFENVIILKIDVDNVTNKRPQAYYDIQNILEWKIKSVPSVVVNEGKSILSGGNAFIWLEEIITKVQEYNPSNMMVNEEFSNIGDSGSILSEQEMKRLSNMSFSDKKNVSSSFDSLMKSRKDVEEFKQPSRTLTPPIKC